MLGCTHYPFLKANIREYLRTEHHREDIDLIDGSYGTAKELRRRLAEKNLLKINTGWPGHVEILTSSSDTDMVEKSYELLNRPEL